jgi:hypothetical protein
VCAEWAWDEVGVGVGVGGREGEAVESLPEGQRESAAHSLQGLLSFGFFNL